jgi:outer membrane lipoprotein-sorting protein
MIARARFKAALTVALAAMVWASGQAAGADQPSRLAPFFARMRGAGRAQVRIERRAFDAGSAQERVVRGRVALEPPALARVDFDGGESVTLREDGGEWLQPTLRQLVRLGPARARSALGWCDLLLAPGAGGIPVRDLPDGRVLLLRPEAGSVSDSAWATLDTSGQPMLLEVREGAGELERLRLRHWTMGSARGRSAFVLAPPHGFEVVDLP